MECNINCNDADYRMAARRCHLCPVYVEIRLFTVECFSDVTSVVPGAAAC